MDDQELCEIVHGATASAMYPRGTHSGETMAVAKAVREACAKVAENFYDNSGIVTGSMMPPLQKKIAAAIRNPSP